MRKKLAGYTLIEIIIVVALLGIVMVMATGMFLNIMRGAVKSRALQEVKQNGNYVIMTMSRMIRNAMNVSCSGLSDRLVIENPDGMTTTFQCCLGADNNFIASISGTMTCSSEGARMTGDNVTVTDCASFINCTAGPPPVIDIFFQLNHVYRGAGAVPPEESAASVFQTTVSPRNY